MTDPQIMEEIRRLTFDYLQHYDRAILFKNKHIKDILKIDIYSQARTPQDVVDKLHQKHGSTPYENLLKHQILAMNPQPWWMQLIETFFIVVTFPLSVPSLILWSWFKRGTVNFMRTEGSIYVDKLLHLCKEAGVRRPSKSAESSCQSINSNTNKNDPSLNKGMNMLSTKGSYQQMQVLRKPSSTERKDDDSSELDVASPVTLSTMDENINRMAGMAEDLTQAMIDRPTMFVEADVMRTKGKAVFMASSPLKQLASRVFQQQFDYAAVWTKPWQELDEFSSQIKVFRQFTLSRRPQTTSRLPVNVIPPAAPSTPPSGFFGRTYAKALTLFHKDSNRLDSNGWLEKARKDWGNGNTRNHYHEALKVAKNNEEYTDVMEVLINFHHEGMRYLEEKADCHNPEYVSAVRQDKINQLNEYVDQLPSDYHLCSSTAKTLELYFSKVWKFLETNELDPAWDAFGKDELLEKSEMKKLIKTDFVPLCLPHYVAMWHQLMGLFHINGASGELLFCTENEARQAQSYMEKALKVLQEHELPDAKFFERECIKPLHDMQAHVEELFQAVPPEKARLYALLTFRDNDVWRLERRCPSYRHETRGNYVANFPFFDAQARRDLKTVDALLESEYGSGLTR